MVTRTLNHILSLSLDHVLHAPQLIKNLNFVHKFTSDNNVSVEFDPLGFTVKALRMRNQILRGNSTGELYPFSSGTPPTTTSPNMAFSTISTSFWHSRLGHSGNDILHVSTCLSVH